MSRFFSLQDLMAEVRQSRLFSQRFENIQCYKLNNLKELCGRLPDENQIYFIETRKSFTAFTFIVYIMRHAGYVRHIYVATYSTNERVINALLRYMDKGFIGTVCVMMALLLLLTVGLTRRLLASRLIQDAMLSKVPETMVKMHSRNNMFF